MVIVFTEDSVEKKKEVQRRKKKVKYTALDKFITAFKETGTKNYKNKIFCEEKTF